MWDKLASVFGSGVSEALDSFKKLVIDTWHLDPAKAAELEIQRQQIEASVNAKVQEQVTELAKVDAADRNSARQREMTLKDHTPATLAFVIVGGFLGMTAFIIGNLTYLHYEIPGPAMGMIGTLVGYLSAKAEQVVSYYFGSSAGSASKQEMIDRLTK